MRGNTDEKEKCLDKLNEMQMFLPFLDFMIEKIKKKNVVPLECQLSKFQHIRSLIIEKNGKYSLEGLTNIEDILQKLITKLDYKGINPREKKVTTDSKPESRDIQNKNESLPSSVPGIFPSTATVTTASSVPDSPNASACLFKQVDSANSTIDVIMKSANMTVVHDSRQDEVTGEVLQCTGNFKDLDNIECYKKSLSSVDKKVNIVKEVELSTDRNVEKDAGCHKSYTPSDVLAFSRNKLLKSVSEKKYGTKDCEIDTKKLSDSESVKRTESCESGSKRTCLIPVSVREKEKSIRLTDKSLMEVLSDISDDEYIVVEDLESGRISAGVSGSEKLKKKKNSDSSLTDRLNGDLESKPDLKPYDSCTRVVSGTLADLNNKKKLRERLCADIAEVHKVPGKSVGGSLRSLKDIKSSSEETDSRGNNNSESHHSRNRKKSASKEMRNERHSDTRERRYDRSDRDLKKSRRKDHKGKGSSSTDGERKRDRRHFRSSEEESRRVHHSKDSHKTERKPTYKEEKRERKQAELEIDKLNDTELAAFVKENMSSFPHLSKLKPEELRRVARSSLLQDGPNCGKDEIGHPKEKSQDVNSNERKRKSAIDCDDLSNISSSSDDVVLREKYESDLSKKLADKSGTESKSKCIVVEDSRNTQSIEETQQMASTPKSGAESGLKETETRWSVNESIPKGDSCAGDSRNAEISQPKEHSTEIRQEVSESFPAPDEIQVLPKVSKPPTSSFDSATGQKIQTISVERITSEHKVLRNVNTCDKQSTRQLIPLNTTATFMTGTFSGMASDSGSSQSMNSSSRYHRVLIEVPRVSSINSSVKSTNYTIGEPKSYGEYKQLKQEYANKLGFSQDEKRNNAECITGESSSGTICQTSQFPNISKSSDSEPKDSLKPAQVTKSVGERKSEKTPSEKSRSCNKTSRKSVDERNTEEKTAKSSARKSPINEQISPFKRLCDNEQNQTVRSHGLKNFKIPKKSRSASTECQISQSDDKDVKSSFSRSSESVEIESRSPMVVTQETEDIKTKDTPIRSSDQPSCIPIIEARKNVESDENSKRNSSEPVIEKASISIDDANNGSKSSNGEKKKRNSGSKRRSSEDKQERKDKVKVESHKEKETGTNGDKVRSEKPVNADGQEKGSSEPDLMPASDEPKNKVDDKAAVAVKQPDGNSKNDSVISNKSVITEEITQELVESVIRKSFEAGEGELLLAKAKLFREIALKLNSKKLKTIQKIINSESDSSSVSSDSSECEKKRRKPKKKNNMEDPTYKPCKKGRREKRKTIKSRQYIESSTDSEEGNGTKVCDKENTSDDKNTSTVSKPEPLRNEDQCKDESENQSKLKKNQRKTKLLEQIFNETPTEDFHLSTNPGPAEKETDQKSKMKSKSKGKTELDRLHDDIRSMFISSGVVTATGQRMCRMLRASGGKMNNLDLVKESAKMVEEERLADRKRKNSSATNKRSRSRSSEKRSLKHRSKSKNRIPVDCESDEMSDHNPQNSNKLNLTKEPIVLVERMNLEDLPYAYKITDLPGRCVRPRGRNVARRGRGHFRTVASAREVEMSLIRQGKIYLLRNLRRCLSRPRRSGRTYRGKKLTEIIQKLPLKMAKIKHLEIGTKDQRKEIRMEQSPGLAELEMKLKKENPTKDFELLDYAFERYKTYFPCLLCGHSTKSITAHYKTEHPESEVLISRLAKSEAMNAILDSKANNYDITALEQACSLEMIKRRVRTKLSESSKYYTCRMCRYGNVTNICHFYSHVSRHTGEYRYKCPVDGCELPMPGRDNVKNHILTKHPKYKFMTSKIIELFPLPCERGILFGYLCSRCNFVQMLRRNIEDHIIKVHSGMEDVRIIKIDLSGKPGEEPKKRRKKKEKTKKSRDLENVEKVENEEGGGDEEDFGDESEPSWASSGENDDDRDDDFGGRVNVSEDRQSKTTRIPGSDDHHSKKQLQSEKEITEKGVTDDREAVTSGRSVLKDQQVRTCMEYLQDADVTVCEVKAEAPGDASPRESINETCAKTEVRKEWRVGPLHVIQLKSEIMAYECCVAGCRYSTHLLTAYEIHITSEHAEATWSGGCKMCDASSETAVDALAGIVSIVDVLKHIKLHIETGAVDMKKSCEDVNDESQSMDVNDSSVSESDTPDMTDSDVSFPSKPLLRVRSLMGDRLSTPRSVSEDEQSRSHSPFTVFESAKEEGKSKSESCFFTIKDVRSLNAEVKEHFLEESCIAPGEVPKTFPPNAEVIAGKPVLVRSCPSPKITLRPDTNAIPINITQAKQAVEIGQLKVVPSPKISDSPSVGLKPLELMKSNPSFVSTSSIRILSPGSVTSQAVILPNFTNSSRLITTVKATDSTSTVTMAQSKKPLPIPKQLVNKTWVPPASGKEVQQRDNVINESKEQLRKKQSLPPLTSLQAIPKPVLPIENPPESPTSKKPYQYGIPFGGRNMKDANIYKEMLTKSKLCQLFKCMAVECSFTCNNETIFTQHIGLHKAQQRIRVKKKPLIKIKKAYNWQQCAYCCEVLVHTGSALSQHILTEHGHCLYQCAYCFYRAVCVTYVDLHQESVHEKIVKDKKKLIYKCKPVPGSAVVRQMEKQIKPHNVKPYLCEHCGGKFFIIQHFVDHLTTQHQSVTAYSCHICKILCFKADRLISHYKLHSYGMYQCAYCTHGTESQKEMLFHLCNFHFSQPPLICARLLENPAKSESVVLDDLKILTFENEPGERELEEAGSEAELDFDRKDIEMTPFSIDLSAIVSELGIDVGDASPKNTISPFRGIQESDILPSASLATMLPNAQFSSETASDSENARILISTELNANNQEKKEEKDVSVPIGQLPIEVLKLEAKESTAVLKNNETNESVSAVLMNLQQKSNVTVSPVTEKNVDEPPTRIMHKLPPTVPVNRGSVIYHAKRLPGLKKLDDVSGPVKENSPLLFQQLCSSKTNSIDRTQSKNHLLTAPVIDKSKPLGDEEPGKANVSKNIPLMKRLREESSEPAKKDERDETPLKKMTLSATSTTPTPVTSTKESSLKICDVRSLLAEKTDAVVLQPPIIRVEDFTGSVIVSSSFEKPRSGVNNTPDDPNKKPTEAGAVEPVSNSNELPSSPEVLILEPEVGNKNEKKELILLDLEEDADARTEVHEEEDEDSKLMTDNDIRKQMEQLRNQMEHETDSLLLDDDTSQSETGRGCDRTDKSEDSTGCFSTEGETSQQTINEDIESSSLDSQQIGDESMDKVKLVTQDSDSQASSSNDSKEEKIDDSKPEGKESEENEKVAGQGEGNRGKSELSGKDLFRCGNEKCNFAAEKDTDLKDHLYVCDFSRESSMLVCPHCSKQFKLSTPYVEHLKLHGEKRYGCGLCKFVSSLETSVTRHLKQKHKCSNLKTLPNETKPGHFCLYPKNYKKEKQEVETNFYSPGDEDKLPLQSIYQYNVKCAKCPYYTKVRSNMVRHLKIHIKSVETEGSIVVPSTAPTNPVPCLDAKERMFDKMTNLAASSQMAQANRDKVETLSPEEEAKLPHFVPEQMRHKCCSPDCNYLTIDDNMLRHHIRALHDEINVYNCPHCKDTVHVEYRFVSLDKIGQHLKYHDSKLYRCYHCIYFHHQRYVVEKHVLEKHPDRRFYVYTVREPKVESASEEEHSSSNDSVTKMWKCGWCNDFESSARQSVLEHLARVHNTKSKYKCKHCDKKSNHYGVFASHFASKHNGLKVECLRSMIQVNRMSPDGGGNTASQEANDHFDTTPLWQRDAPRVRHIRGILIEEEEIKTKRTKRVSSDTENEVSSEVPCPPDMFYCPLCTEKKRVFRSKSAENFRNHLYQELNYQQYACISCGKMFVDRKDCERHHLRAHPNRTLSIKQTKEDSEIKFWVDKVVAKQLAQIEEKKRRLSEPKEVPPVKKKKLQSKTESAETGKKNTKINRLTRSNSTAESTKIDSERGKRRNSDERSEFVRQTRSLNAGHEEGEEGEEKSRKCPHCDVETGDLCALKTHIMLSHLRMGKLLCPYCGESFQSEKDGVKHCKSAHPSEVPKTSPNPDEQKVDLKDDFWLVEYGFGREKQGKGSEGEKKERSRTTSRRDGGKTTESPQPKSSPNVYSCGYCMIQEKDQQSIIEHFESQHKGIHGIETGTVAGNVYYRCNACSEKLFDLDSLNAHAKDRHPNTTLQFEIRKSYKLEKRNDCGKSGGGGGRRGETARDGCYRCPQCQTITSSYLDCIDHFNEHYPRYACTNCSLRFFTEEEVEGHQNESKHRLPFAMTIPSENMLEEYKAGVRVRLNGQWVPLPSGKKTNPPEEGRDGRKAKTTTSRKSTTQTKSQDGSPLSHASN